MVLVIIEAQQNDHNWIKKENKGVFRVMKDVRSKIDAVVKHISSLKAKSGFVLFVRDVVALFKL